MSIEQAVDFLTASQHKRQIISAWTDQLSQYWDGNDQYKLKLFFNVIENRSDAFSFLMAHRQPDAESIRDTIISRTIERIHSEDFDIADFFSEIKLLHEIIDHALPKDLIASLVDEDGKTSVRQTLDGLFETVIRETSVVYEFFAERGTKALCILNGNSNISYANKSARKLLGKPAREGACFKSCLELKDQARVDPILNNLTDDTTSSPAFATLQVRGADGNTHSLSVEFARLEHTTERSMFYATLSPASKVLGVDDEVLESFEQGIVRVDSSKVVYYANKAARKIIGQDPHTPFQPIHVYDLFKEEKERAKVDNELQKRSMGKLSRYETQLTRNSGQKIPISINAIPEIDSAGNHIGSVAILRNLEEERAHADFAQRLLVGGHTWKDDLEHLSLLLMRYVKADAISIHRWTDDMRYVSTVSSLTRGGENFSFGRRWFPMSDALIKWNKEEGMQRYPNLLEFLKKPMMEELAEDPAVKKMVNEDGIKSFMRLPIMKGGDNKAGVSFLSTEFNRFSKGEADLISDLPIADVVLSAIQQKDREEKTFQFKLMAALSQCESFEDIAKKITGELARHYQWDNVSLFDVAEDVDTLRLIQQSQGTDTGYLLPEDFKQNSKKGLLGKAVLKNERIYVEDVSTVKDYCKGNGKTRSELVIPIFSKMYEPKRVFWLLNIEHSQTGFLIDQEIKELEDIAEHIEFIVNRMMDRFTYENAMRTTSDGVIITDANGDIRNANPASLGMLNYKQPDDLIGGNIAKIFSDPVQGKKFIHEKHRDSYKVKLLKSDNKEPLTVLMSKLELPKEISDKYFVFKSLALQERLADLEAIEELVGDIVNQVKTPLSLMHGMLHRLTLGDNTQHQLDLADFVKRSRHLLKKVELTYDRVAYSRPTTSTNVKNNTYIHLDRIFKTINDELSVQDDDIIDLNIDGALRPISGDRHQIRFVCDSLVSYLLRNLSQDEKIVVDLAEENDRLNIRVHAPFPRNKMHDYLPETDDIDRTITEISFGQKAVQKFVENHDGEFETPVIDRNTDRLEFKMSFPVNTSGEE